jgi:diadenosine tetraphosphatase ApaH/serine/threonine PP2A family protein phosphatase
MRLALLSDIHANLEALQGVLRDCESQQLDKICCLGDVVGYGCDPAECLALVQQSCSIVLMGNHEFAVLGKLSHETMNQVARHSLAVTKTQLVDRHLAYLDSLPFTAVLDDVLLVHASPHEPERWHYILSLPAAVCGFEAFTEQIAFFGHTHLPMIFSASSDGEHHARTGHSFDPDDDCRYLVNVGSVGQPRDDDPRACYVVYDTEAAEISYRRVEYDFRLTQQKMAKADVPQVLIDRLKVGR